QFDRHLPCISDSRAFQIPVRFLVVAKFANRLGWRFIQTRCDLRSYANGGGFVELQLAALGPHEQTVHAEIDRMTFAIRHIRAATANAVHPGVKSQLIVEFDIATSQTDSLAVDAGEIGLAADAGAETAIERVIPDVEFPYRRRIYGRNEVNRAMRNVRDVF